MTSSELDIVLATYNGEEYVVEQLTSIVDAREGLVNRIIVSDDASTDKTLAVIDEFDFPSDINVDVFTKEEDDKGGPKYNFSRGLSYSLSNYVMFCDQDDVWCDFKISRSLQLIKDMEDRFGKNMPLLVFTDLSVVDSNLNVISNSFFQYQGMQPEWANDFGNLLLQNIAPGCTMIVNRALIEKAGEIPEQAEMHDWWFMLVASAFGKIACINEPTILYRQHGRNQVGAKKYSFWTLLKSIDKARKSTLGVVTQAKCFKDRYGEELKVCLSTPHYNKLLVVSQLNTLPKHKRIASILFGGVRKNTLLRNVGLMVVALLGF